MIKTDSDDIVALYEHRIVEETARDLAPELTEDRVAIEYVQRHAGSSRFDHTTRTWFIWTGARWQKDETRRAFAYARDLARELAQAPECKTDRRRVGSLKFANSVEAFARADQRIAVTRERWNNDIDKLGTPNGYVDLRTAEQFDSDPDLFITRSVAVEPHDVVNCPRWMKFVDEITNGDATLKTFLQRFIGYSLTGETREQKLAFIYGPGGSGKSTFTNIIAQIMADYCTSAAMETFTNSKFDQHPEALARLDGVRLVISSETEAGHRLRENRIKMMTGGDAVTAHYMRQDSFVYRPQFKLLLLGNHAPAISNLDSAMQRRVLIVPFDCKPAEPDQHLVQALAEESSGILRWAIDGAKDWYTSGLVMPKAITDATSRYFDEQNMFGQWLDECCVVDPGNRNIMERSTELFASWHKFAEQHGEEAGTQKDFNERLHFKGFVREQIKALSTKGCRGIRLKVSQLWQDRE
jgi:putative DNA primase/helicase